MHDGGCRPQRCSSTSFLKQAEIAALIQRERAARDGAARWEQMATFYHPESSIDVAWFQGSGQEFVQATEKNWRTDAINFHELGVAVVDHSQRSRPGRDGMYSPGVLSRFNGMCR